MKPKNSQLAIVTATVDPQQAEACFASWERTSAYACSSYIVYSRFSPEPLTPQRIDHTRKAPYAAVITRHGGGVVPAFAEGVAHAFRDGAEAVLCLHDDVEILEQDWDLRVLDALDLGVRFAGFGGATSLGSADLYRTPYDPMQLARGGFVSNMRDAEAHGRRSVVPVPCVVFDGFSQLGTKDWFGEAWQVLVGLGVVHHFYDGMLGCLAARAGVQPGVMIPVACHHWGGRSAVGNAAYQAWAREQTPEGDQGFWQQAHRIGYDAFSDCLPLRVP